MASMASLEGGRRTELGCGMAGAKKLHGFHSFTVLLQPTAFSAATYRSPGSCANATSGRSAGAPPDAYHAARPPRMKRASKPRSMSVFVTLHPTSKPYAQYTATGLS